MEKIITESGDIYYYNDNNLYHRKYGPAIEFTNGNKYYWCNDICYSKIRTDEEWKRFIKLMVFL